VSNAARRATEFGQFQCTWSCARRWLACESTELTYLYALHSSYRQMASQLLQQARVSFQRTASCEPRISKPSPAVRGGEPAFPPKAAMPIGGSVPRLPEPGSLVFPLASLFATKCLTKGKHASPIDLAGAFTSFCPGQPVGVPVTWDGDILAGTSFTMSSMVQVRRLGARSMGVYLRRRPIRSRVSRR
jgi:hypothetical protein